MATIETTVSDAETATFDARHASGLPGIEALDCLDPEPARICPLCWGSVEALDGREPEPARMCFPSNVSEVEALDARDGGDGRICYLPCRAPEVEALDARDAGSARGCVCANPPFFPTPEA